MKLYYSIHPTPGMITVFEIAPIIYYSVCYKYNLSSCQDYIKTDGLAGWWVAQWENFSYPCFYINFKFFKNAMAY